jgi:NADH-quinone oxidoreductase subunit C
MERQVEQSEPLRRIGSVLAAIEHQPLPARDGLLTLALAPRDLHPALARLKSPGGFELLTLVTAVDRLPLEPRFELVHQLHSLAHNQRLRLRTLLASDAARVPSCTDLWPGAAFMERECFDMFGIVFAGHPGLKRLLMPEGYGHHPLRKDFPHQGIEPDRLYREWDRQRRAGWSAQEAGR